MQILARQNIFHVHKSPNLIRQNRFIQNLSFTRHSRDGTGINTARHFSIDFDQLYNPYRLRQLGSSQKNSSTTYKSMQTKQCVKLSLSDLKTIKLGQKLYKYEIQSADNSESIVSNYLKMGQILNEDHNNISNDMINNKYDKVEYFQTNESSILSQQIREDMFGNIEKITQKQQSCISFPSQNDALTIFYSIISKNSF